MSSIELLQSIGIITILTVQDMNDILPILPLILLGTSLFIILGYIFRRRNLVIRYNAPDYKTAKKIKRLKLDSYSELLISENNLNQLINEAKLNEKRGRLLYAVQYYEKVLKNYQDYIDPQRVASCLFRIANIHKEMGILNSEYSLFKRFPRVLKNPGISGLHFMIQALIAESEKNYGLAEKAWNEAQFYTIYLGVEYKAICQGYLINADFREWISNPILPNPENLIFRINEWKNLCETHNLFNTLCQVFLMYARVSLATYKFQEAEDWFKKLLELSENSSHIYYHDLAIKEIKLYENHKTRMISLFKARNKIPREEQSKELIAYIRKARRIKQEYWNQQLD
ncbi:MAG: hypothetical protein ACXADY_16395 [Candidatus Hodarchaeales archaeon]|jgi:tetratricopeptide (TPR) repeat protein